MRSWLRGHEVYFADGSQRYADTDEPVDSGERPCKKCNRFATPEGHDACLGVIQGAQAACCGHGVYVGYVLFQNGSRIDFGPPEDIPLQALLLLNGSLIFANQVAHEQIMAERSASASFCSWLVPRSLLHA